MLFVCQQKPSDRGGLKGQVANGSKEITSLWYDSVFLSLFTANLEVETTLRL